MNPRLLLASASQRRKELLERAGFQFDIEPVDIDESFADGEHPVAATVRVARAKALAAASRRNREWLVLGADTSVVCEGRVFGKPRDQAQAVDMLLRLAGRNHRVYTAWALAAGGGALPSRATTVGVSQSIVRMREVSRREAVAYAACGEPLDKAGAYAVQGEGARFVVAVVGSRDNVIGLPLGDIVPFLARADVEARGR